MARESLLLGLVVGGCSLVPPPRGPSYGTQATGRTEDCASWDAASMAWTGIASAAAGLSVAGAAVLPTLEEYPDAALGVTISDAVLGALAATAALLANEAASRYSRCAEGVP